MQIASSCFDMARRSTGRGRAGARAGNGGVGERVTELNSRIGLLPASPLPSALLRLLPDEIVDFLR